MKKGGLLIKILCLLLPISVLLASCGEAVESGAPSGGSATENSQSVTETSESSSEEQIPEQLAEYLTYSNQVYTKPFWKGSIVYNETVCFMEKTDVAPLMYKIDEIISVNSYRLDIAYEEGIDYEVENGCLKLTENTKIPFFTEAEMYPTTGDENYLCSAEGKNYFLKSEGALFPNHQIAVTYRHSDVWSGFVQQSQAENFPKTLGKLAAKEQTKILFYGDSITTGCNSSDKIGIAPHAEIYPEMIVTYLKNKYDNPNIECVNTSKGGTGYSWATQNVQANVIDQAPDLVVLAFGINDRCAASTYQNGMRILVETICEGLPNAEIMLVATTLPNSESSKYYVNQYLFEDILAKIAEDKPNVGIAKMSSMHSALMANKRFRDMTGNGLNHPNDFLARAYAQVILKAFTGDL